MLATLGGLSFRGDRADILTRLAAGETVYTIEPDGLKGWLDGTDMRRDSVARPEAHGEFDVPGYLTSRIPSLAGSVLAPSGAALQLACDALTGLLADGSAGELAVEIEGRTLTAMVRRQGKPDVNVLDPKSAAAYGIQFWAADPRRYGALHEFGPGSSVSGIEHDGNFPALPVLEITGATAYTVTGPGGRLITVSSTSGTHRIDLASGGLFIGGVRVIGGVSVYQPWAVPAGAAVAASVSAGSLKVEVRDAFV